MKILILWGDFGRRPARFSVLLSSPFLTQRGSWVNSSVSRTALQEVEGPAASRGPAGPRAVLPVLSRSQIFLLPGAAERQEVAWWKDQWRTSDLMILTGHDRKNHNRSSRPLQSFGFGLLYNEGIEDGYFYLVPAVTEYKKRT